MKKNVAIIALLALSLFLVYSLDIPTNDDAITTENITASKSEITLDLSNSNLTSLPANVLNKTDLEVLIISNNNISGALPAEIRNLKNLRTLDASDNEMTGLPAELGQLDSLEVLNVSNNKLTGLPYELGNLRKLKVLDISGNNYSEQDLAIIKSSLPSTVEIKL